MSRYEGWEGEDDSTPRPISLFRLSALSQQVKKRRRWILTSSVIFSVVIYLLSFLIKDSYVSTAVILPPKPQQSISSLLSGTPGNLSALAGGGGLGAVSLKNPNDVYISLLQSRTLNTNLVNQFDLKAYYHKATMQDTLKALAKHASIDLGKDNLLRISVRSHDANFSSRLANAFVDQLHDMNTSMALTESAQRRLFYQEQLDQEKVLLAKAETNLQQTQVRTGLLQPVGQADIASRSIAALRTQISAREAELQSLSTFDAPGNSDYMQLQAQLSSLRGQLTKLENSTKTQTPGDIEVPTAQLPKSALEYARNYREVQQHEQVYALLLKQFEAAKIDEAKTAPIIEVVDRAIPAELPSGPPKWLIGLGALLLALLVNLAWCVAAYALQVMGIFEPQP